MAVFRYRAVDGGGGEREGTLEAADLRAATAALRERDLYPLEVEEQADALGLDAADLLAGLLPVRGYDLVFFFQQMALMVRAGLPLTEGLEIAANLARGRMRRVLEEVGEAVRGGQPLSEAMAAAGVFPPLSVQLVRSAEASGELERILERIAEDLERRIELRRNLVTSLTYPAIVVLAAVGVVSFLVTGIIPKMAEFLQSRGGILPPSTRRLLAISGFFQTWGWAVAAGALVVLVGLALWYRHPRGRLLLDRALLTLPKLGTSLLLAGMAQLSWSMAQLLGSGLTLLQALEITATLVPNRALARALEQAREQILQGRSLAVSLEQPPLPRLLPQLVAVGERTGLLEKILEDLGRHYQQRLQVEIKRLTALIEPALILVIGGIVGYVYYAFFQALFSLSG